MPLTVSNTIDAPAAAPAVLPRLRVGKLCIAVQGATPAELMSRVDAALKDSPFIEFRLDSLAQARRRPARYQVPPQPPP